MDRYRKSVLRIGRRHGLSDQLLDEAMQELRIRLGALSLGATSSLQ